MQHHIPEDQKLKFCSHLSTLKFRWEEASFSFENKVLWCHLAMSFFFLSVYVVVGHLVVFVHVMKTYGGMVSCVPQLLYIWR